MTNHIKGFGFIKRNVLGRRREVVTRIVSEQEEEDIISIMKEVETDTTIARNDTIEKCQEQYEQVDFNVKPMLNKKLHKSYLEASFSNDLPPQMAALDASQPWMLYWIANSLAVLDEQDSSENLKRRIYEKLFAISPDGGPFGGGVGQLPHLASTYAAINALALCDNVGGCWDKINKSAIYEWLLSLKQPDGGFKTCLKVGEVDTRGVYCALSIASMLGILTNELRQGVKGFLISCQNYEGGFGGCPHEDEAHGGYTFCAVASLCILGALDKVDVTKLAEWCSQRQYNVEKGLSGRGNKLVDGCYSFWVGGTAAILEINGYGGCIDKNSLREYILYCCQAKGRPGLRDKPGTNPDFYHTNYVLLGLAITESDFILANMTSNATSIKSTPSRGNTSSLAAINPIYGLPSKNLENFIQHFI